MRKNLGIGIVLLLAVLPAAAQEVHVDYDRWARFSTFKTFAYYPTEDTSLAGISDMMHDRIKAIIMKQMASGRLKEDPVNPDLYVTYHASTEEALRLDVTQWGYGYPGGWYWDPYWANMGMSTATVRQYTKGVLIIDVWNAKEETLVWRGTAVATVSKNPEKNAKKIEKAVQKLGKKWQKMKPGF